MVKIFIQTTLMVLLGLTAWAGYLPPPDSPYWCYKRCIASDYSNHKQCVRMCYGNCFVPSTEDHINLNSQDKNPVQIIGPTCCSWVENITGCMADC
ncbi:MAG: hypothetical protein ACXVCP_02235 [Bdellovibrio sp.]